MKIAHLAAAALLLSANPAFAHNHQPRPVPAPDLSNTNTNINNLSPQGGAGGAGGLGGNAKASPSVNNTNNINYPQQVPNIVGPVAPGSVPVFSIYGQLDHEQKGVYGAQLSIPLQFR